MHKLSMLITLAAAALSLASVGVFASDQVDGNLPILNPPPPQENLTCPPIVINGTLGSMPGSGFQNGRMFRDGIPSVCGVPKTCSVFTTTGARAYDLYTIPNQSGNAVCVNAQLVVATQTGCNMWVVAYLGSYNSASMCTNYLADTGSSSGIPPTPVGMGFDVPAGANLLLVVQSANTGEIGCQYTLTVTGELCPPSTPVESGTWGAIKSIYSS